MSGDREMTAPAIVGYSEDSFSGAAFSEDRLFRYALWRRWLPTNHATMVLFGVNPSDADETTNDPTSRKGIYFAQREGCGRLLLLNPFARISTDPRLLYESSLTTEELVGPRNDEVIRACLARPTIKIVVAAWGIHGRARWRDDVVRRLVAESGHQLYCFGTTKHGLPKHPLYLRNDTPLEPYTAKVRA
jgi:hypothetical protein